MDSSEDNLQLDRLLMHARVASLVGSILISISFLFDVLITAAELMAFFRVGVDETHNLTWWLLGELESLLFFAARVLLVLFLWHFWKGDNPLTVKQAHHVGIAGILILSKVVLNTLTQAAPAITVVEGPTPVEYSRGGPTGLNLKMFVFAVFVFCAVQILRYVRALKIESDAIV